MFNRLPSELRRSRADTAPTQQARVGTKGVGYLRVIAQMGRLRALPALLTPVLWGAAAAHWQVGTISIWWALVLLFSFGALALACNYLGAYVDYMRHVRNEGLNATPANERNPQRQSHGGLYDATTGCSRACCSRKLSLASG